MKQHWPFAILAAIALALLLINLGSDYLWADEGDTAVLASSILKFGVPKAWDGVTFSDSDKGARVNNQLIMVSHPWAQYYVAAVSFGLFGKNTFAARLPFALAGWLTILLTYLLVWEITSNRWAAFGAALLTVSSVQFLLYSRQCRNYSLNMFLTCALVWIFFRLKSVRYCILFTLAAIFLFHTNPIGIVLLSALGVLTLVYPPFAPQRRWFWLSLPITLLFTLPWFALARSGYSETMENVTSIRDFVLRIGQYLVECASVTPLIGFAILLCVSFIFSKFKRQKSTADEHHRKQAQLASGGKFLQEKEVALLVVTFTTIFFYAISTALIQPSEYFWTLGIRYTPAVIPLIAMLAGILITTVSGERRAVWLILILILGFTKLGQLTPWVSGNNKLQPEAKEFIAPHVPTRTADSFLYTEQLLFLRDLWRENYGTVAKSCEFVRQLAKPGDILIANYCWEPLYFHTRLPQGLKIFPDYPVYEAARRQGLPEYTFSTDRVRWIVWRPFWEGYQGYYWKEVIQQIVAHGGRVKQLAEVEETIWENRENIHFRRFSGGRHLFPWFERAPDAGIFQVDWPND